MFCFQFVFVAGIVLMSLGTYVNLGQSNDAIAIKPVLIPNPKPFLPLPEVAKPSVLPPVVKSVEIVEPVVPNEVKPPIGIPGPDKKPPDAHPDERIEPVEPIAPVEPVEPVEPAADPNKVVKEVKEIEKTKEELKVKEEKADKLLEQLEHQKEEHKQIIEEQKEVLEKMKQHLEADEEVESAKKVPIEPQVNKVKSNQTQGVAQQQVPKFQENLLLD